VAYSGGDMSIIMNNVLSELVVLIPAVAVVLFHGEKLGTVIPLRFIKFQSFLLTILYMVLLYPLVTFVNALSMLFVDNTVMEVSDQILGLPLWQVLLSVGLFGPFVEEIVFRGILLQSYQRTGRIIGSILLSSVFFGLMHLNFNQFAYAAVMGIMFALLVEATGSVLTSFVAHSLFNSIEVMLLYLSSDALDEAESYLDKLDLGNELLISIGIFFILAIIGTSLAVCVAYKISDIEGRKLFFSSIPKCKKQGYKLITVPAVVSVVLSAAYMIVMDFLLDAFL
jgi:membrane protease YdiL (CAAX protease family)